MWKRENRGGRKACWVGVLGAITIWGGAGSTLYASTWTWAGHGNQNSWDSISDWSPTGSFPNSSTASVIFGNNGAGNVNVGTVNLSQDVSAASIFFSNDTGGYILNSTGTASVTVPSVTMASNVTGLDNINLSSNAYLQFPAGSNLTITNNSLSGGTLTIGYDTVVGTPHSSGTTISGGVIFQGPGTIYMTGTFATNLGFVVYGGFTKIGPGLLDYNGHGSSLNGPTVLNGGTMEIDYLQFGNKPKAGPSASLVLDNGVLQLMPAGSNISLSYSNGTTINAGHTDIVASGQGTITLGTSTITRTLGGTTDISPSTGPITFIISTSSGTTNGLWGSGPAYATVAGGTTWASVSSGNIVGLTSFMANVLSTGVNTDVTISSSASGMLTNSLRFNGSATSFTLLSAGTLQSGGVLVTPTSAAVTITGNSLTTSSSGELLFHVYNAGGLAVNSTLISTTGLTKTGPGILTLSGSNTSLTGPVNINRGSLTISTVSAVNSASQINFNDDRAGSDLQQFTIDLGNGASGTISAPLALSAFSATNYGTYFSTGNSSASAVFLAGPIASAGGLTTPIRFTGSVSDTSGFNLTNAGNSFTGNISLLHGSLGITSDAVLGNSANALILETNNSTSGGLVFLNSGVNVTRPVNLASNARIVSNGTDSNTISGLISGAGTLSKDGSGTLILSNPANSIPSATVNSGNLLFTAASFAPSHLVINKGAVAGGKVVVEGDSANLASYQSRLLSGYNTGNWSSAAGISSTTATSSNTNGIAYATGASYLLFQPATSFVSGYNVQPTDILLKYTYLGDANLDGAITIDDYLQIDAGFHGNFNGTTSIAHWIDGDFNYDGVVNFKDYAAIDASYLAYSNNGPLAASEISQHTALFGTAYLLALAADLQPSPVPEPLSCMYLLPLALILPRRRFISSKR